MYPYTLVYLKYDIHKISKLKSQVPMTFCFFRIITAK